MSEEAKASERTAIRDAFEGQIRDLCDVLATQGFAVPDADLDAACRAFKRGLGVARKVMQLALNIISE
jgi:hypothetical protein